VERSQPSPRFIAALIAAAAVLLGLGASFRPRAVQQTTAVPSNELATLPGLSQRRALRDLADYIGERSNSSAGSILYLPDYGASALVTGPDSALTAVAAKSEPEAAVEPVRLLKIPRPARDSTQRVVLRREPDTLRSRWALVVARSPSGQVLSLAGLVGGRVDSRCGELELRELIFDSSIPVAFGGGGVFDLDGNPVALVVPCGSRGMLVPLADVAWGIEQQQSVPYRLWVELGFRVDSAAELRVSEVRSGSRAARAGLRKGDRLQNVDDLAGLLPSEDQQFRLTLRRGKRGVVLRSIAQQP
jgi:hypothetical protein